MSNETLPNEVASNKKFSAEKAVDIKVEFAVFKSCLTGAASLHALKSAVISKNAVKNKRNLNINFQTLIKGY
ncbi:hypothetical protein PTRA_a1730 [Pseudoalteromonas translucida KMM 520]|uniref:Uncharacterized protein n=1 Tax=Pseudoalteromonas translucida KMM 520 TaxID=1315283 RepID=A0A0U2VE90_9GAMM|nr:hypothetical protein PTRA_a1730 [Pseudoalteromonas translucida KMM 520]